MSLADEISKLDELRTRGALSDDEFERAKARLLDGASGGATGGAFGGAGAPPPPGLAAVNALRRSTTDKWVGGVCGGLAVSTGLESWVWRLIFAVLFFFGGTGLLVYALLWIFVPTE